VIFLRLSSYRDYRAGLAVARALLLFLVIFLFFFFLRTRRAQFRFKRVFTFSADYQSDQNVKENECECIKIHKNETYRHIGDTCFLANVFSEKCFSSHIIEGVKV